MMLDYLGTLTLQRGPTTPRPVSYVTSPLASYKGPAVATTGSHAAPALRETEETKQAVVMGTTVHNTASLRETEETKQSVVAIRRSAQIVGMTILLLVVRLPEVFHAATQKLALQRTLHDVGFALHVPLLVMSALYVAVLNAATEVATKLSLSTATSAAVSVSGEVIKKMHGMIKSPRAEYLATLSVAPKKKWVPPSGYRPANKIWTSLQVKTWSAPAASLASLSTKLESRAEAMTMGAIANSVPTSSKLTSPATTLSKNQPTLGAPTRKWKKPEGYVPGSRSAGNLE